MKEIVTAWQIRDVAGEQTLNDHGDAAYDAEVLERLATLDADTAAWLEGLATTLRRLRSTGRGFGAPSSEPRTVTSGTWHRPASTATTACGSSSTRT